MGGVSLGGVGTLHLGSARTTGKSAGFVLPPSQGDANFVGIVLNKEYSAISDQSDGLPLFNLPAKATLLMVNIDVNVIFDVSFSMNVGLSDGTKFTSNKNSLFTGVSDHQFLKNPYTVSNSASTSVYLYKVGGGAFPTLTSGRLKVYYLYVIGS